MKKTFLILLASSILLVGCYPKPSYNPSIYSHNQKIINETEERFCKREGSGSVPPGDIKMSLEEGMSLAIKDGCLKGKKFLGIHCYKGHGVWYFTVEAEKPDDVNICKVDVESQEVKKTYYWELNTGLKLE